MGLAWPGGHGLVKKVNIHQTKVPALLSRPQPVHPQVPKTGHLPLDNTLVWTASTGAGCCREGWAGLGKWYLTRASGLAQGLDHRDSRPSFRSGYGCRALGGWPPPPLTYPSHIRRHRLSHSPMRTPGWTSPEPPRLAGTGSPSSHWQLTGRTGWLTAHRAGQNMVRSDWPYPNPLDINPNSHPRLPVTQVPSLSPTRPGTQSHLQLLLGLLRNASFGGKQGGGRWCDGDLRGKLGGG